MVDTPVPVNLQVMTSEELDRQYGQAKIQEKILSQRIIFLEQQYQQLFNQQMQQGAQQPIK